VGIVFVVLTVTVAFDVVRAGGKGLAAEDAPGDETHVPGPVWFPGSSRSAAQASSKA
jgi:hypothetical protein